MTSPRFLIPVLILLGVFLNGCSSSIVPSVPQAVEKDSVILRSNIGTVCMPSASCKMIVKPYPALSTVSVDVRQYMAATISNSSGTGNMLCASNNKATANFSASCITSYLNGSSNGEVKISYGLNNNINNYIAIGSGLYNPFGDGQIQYIGGVRNFTGYDTSTTTKGTLRCFTTARSPNINCTAPPSGQFFGVPYLIKHLPIVSAATELATENPDGSPARGIPGALITTPYAGGIGNPNPTNYWNIGVNTMSATCAQSHQENTYSQGQVVYVQQFNFGGSIGVQDAIVTDGFSYANNPDSIERYYYVSGYGLVREAVSWAASGSSKYDNASGHTATNIYHNYLLPLDKTLFNSTLLTTSCPQGSAVAI